MFREEAKRQLRELAQRIGEFHGQGRFQQAIDLAVQACDLARQELGADHPYYAASLNNLGALYDSTGNYAAAEPLLLQALELRRELLGEENSDFATSLNNLANLYSSLGNYAAAEPLIKKAASIDRRVLGEQHPGYATDLNSLAELYRSMGKYAEAEPLLRQVLEIRRQTQGEDHPEFATALSNLGVLYDSMGNYAAAEPIQRQALEIRRKVLGEDHPDFATGLNNLGTLYCLQGNYNAAEPLFVQALEVSLRALGEDHGDVAGSMNNLARLYQSMGNNAAAEPLYRRAVEIYERALGEEHPLVAAALNNLAALYVDMGDYRSAEQLYRKSIDISRKAVGEEHPHFVGGLNNLGLLYRSMGNYKAAEPLYRRALEISRRSLGEEHPDFAQQLNNMALLHGAMGNYAEAEPLLRQALEIRRRQLGESHPDFAQSLNNLAAFYEDSTGNYAEAERLYRQALGIIRKARGEEHPDVASCLSNLAFQCYSMGNYVAAESLYLQALDIRSRVLGEDHPDFASNLSHLAAIYAATNRPVEALPRMRHAAAIQTRMIGQVFSFSSESQRMAYITTTLGAYYLQLSLVVRHLLDSPEAAYAALDLVFQRKGIGAEALAAQRDAVLRGKYPASEAYLRDLATLRMQIAQKTLAGPGVQGIEVHRKLLAEWNARKEKLEADLARQIPEMNVERKLRTADRQAVALALPGGSALVEFVRFNDFDFKAVPARGESQLKPARYLAFILTAGEPDNVHMIDLGEAEGIDQMIAKFRAGITGETESRGSEDVRARPTQVPKASQVLGLRAAVFDRLLAALGGRKRLLIAPDGDLSRLPFEVLPTSDGGRLIDDYHISYLGTGRDVLRFREAKSGRPGEPLVIADPDLDLGGKAVAPASPAAQPARMATAPTGRQSRDLDPRTLHFEPLPGTRVEGERVAAMLGVRPWLGGAALEGPLKACNSPRILHLATHGFFLQDQKLDRNKELRQEPSSFGGVYGGEPRRMLGAGLENPLLRSGLVLAGFNTWCRGGSLPPEAEDGLLTAEDVSGLNLLDTDLVVLSACETGLGDVRTGEGVFGLRRAFVLAGTKGLVMSLWKVPDEETRKLMEDFYRRILKKQPGQSRAEALRAAQLTMKENEEYRDPLYWGAFIYEGDPGPAS